MKKFIYILFVLFTICLYAQNSEIEYRVESLSFEEGVSHNLVYSIIQDKYGYMWFGTMYGLIRYDGINYIKYKHDPGDTTTLSNDDIVCILESSSGNLWLGTFNGGLNRFIRSENRFERFTKDYFGLSDKWDGTIWEMEEDADENVWIATRGAGVIKFNSRSGKYKVYDFSDKGKNDRRNNSIYGLYFSELSGDLWLTSGGGLLNIYDPENDEFISYDPLNSQNEPGFDYLTKVTSYNDTTLLLGSNKGYALFNLKNNEFTKLSFYNDNLLSNSSVQSISFSCDDKIWTGTNRGLFVTDLISNRTRRIEGNKIKINNAITLCIDKTGIVWAGSYLGGIFKIVSGQFLFDLKETDFEVNAFKNYNGSILIGGSTGLKQYSINEDKLETLSVMDKLNYAEQITSLEKDKRGNYWIGTNNGLYLYSPSNGLIKRFISTPGKQTTLSHNYINEIYSDSKNNIWIGTSNGLNKFSYAANNFTRFMPSNSGIDGINILSIYEDSSGDIWAGTFKGLNRYVVSADSFVVYKQDPADVKSISNNYVYAILDDASGRLWFATAGGLNLFNRDDESFSYYDKNNGLASPVLFGLEQDSSGYIWISSNKGISRFNPSTEEFSNYDIRDGLQSNMFNRSSLKLPDGNIVFGGIKGFNIINTQAIKSDTNNAEVIITSIQIFDDDLADELNINELSEIELDYDENFIRIEFAETDYTNPEKNQYRYMLEGLENSWNSNGTSNIAVYTNLPAGEYSFKVQAADSRGIWSNNSKTFRFIINPPFWETTWFSFLVLVLSLLIVYSLYKRKVLHEIKKRIELEKIHVVENEKVRKKAADDFHDELGHHITKISLYSEILKRQTEQVSREALVYINKISDLTRGLSTGVRDFIWTLDPDKDTLYEVAVRLKDFGDELFDKTGVSFTVEGISEDFEKIKLSLDWRRHLTLIFKEAMNNALKYAECSDVYLSFHLVNQTLSLSLRDNGVGFDDALKNKGRGLDNLRKRAISLKSKLEIIQHDKSGTEIKFEGNPF